MSPSVSIGLVGLIVLIQGFFSGSEMAMIAANRAKLESDANHGSKLAAGAISLLQREDQLLGTCLIGTNLCLISATTLVSNLVIQSGRPEYFSLLFAPLAILFGEAVPKTVYQHHATTLAPFLSVPLRIAQYVFYPVLLIVAGWASLLKRALGRDTTPSREDLMMLLDADEGTDINPQERRIIRRVLEMKETLVEDAMTPLVEVIALSASAPVSEAIDAVLRFGHSRIMVFENRVDNIVGVVNHSQLLFDAHPDDTLRPIIRSVYFVPESKVAPDLLTELRLRGEELSVVVDEYGGVVGIVTIEDLLEEMVGEIRDERDRHRPGLHQLSSREWRIPARAEIDEVAALIGHPLPVGPYETVAGLLLRTLGRIPAQGDKVQIDGLEFVIVEATERAIIQVRLTIPALDATQ